MQSARELGARAHAELGIDMRQVAGHRPLAEEQRRSHLTVRATLGHQDGNPALGGRQPVSRVRPPILPSSSRARSAQLAAPSCSKPASAAAIASRAGRFCRVRLRTTPSASNARACPNGSPTAPCCATACCRRTRPGRRPAGRRHEAAAPRHLRVHPFATEPRGIGLPDVDHPHPVVDPAELEQRLGVVGAPPAVARLAPPELGGPPIGFAEPGRAA